MERFKRRLDILRNHHKKCEASHDAYIAQVRNVILFSSAVINDKCCEYFTFV